MSKTLLVLCCLSAVLTGCASQGGYMARRIGPEQFAAVQHQAAAVWDVTCVAVEPVSKSASAEQAHCQRVSVRVDHVRRGDGVEGQVVLIDCPPVKAQGEAATAQAKADAPAAAPFFEVGRRYRVHVIPRSRDDDEHVLVGDVRQFEEYVARVLGGVAGQ